MRACAALCCACCALRAYRCSHASFFARRAAMLQRCYTLAVSCTNFASLLCAAVTNRIDKLAYPHEIYTRITVVPPIPRALRGTASAPSARAGPGGAGAAKPKLCPSSLPRRRPACARQHEALSSVDTAELGGSLSRPSSRRRTPPLPPSSATQLQALGSPAAAPRAACARRRRRACDLDHHGLDDPAPRLPGQVPQPRRRHDGPRGAEEGQEGPGDAREGLDADRGHPQLYITTARVDGRRDALGPVRVLHSGDAAWMW